jgi:ribonuclease BN (tRNA processing enzyme)
MASIDLLQNDLRILGTDGSKSQTSGTSCLQVSDTIVIDAGNIIQVLGDDAAKIEHIFLTHSHLDHIVDIAFLVERYFYKRQKSLKIYGSKATLEALEKHYFNDTIWPNFMKIPMVDSAYQSVELIPITPQTPIEIEKCTIKAIDVEHTVPTFAYVIEKRFFSLLYAPDTAICENLWREIEENRKIDTLMIDLSFPSEQEELANISKHLTPKLLKERLEHLQRELKIYAIHLKAPYHEAIINEVTSDPFLSKRVSFIQNGAYIKKGLLQKDSRHEELEMLTALAKEKDLDKILERILVQVMKLTRAEGGTVYLKEENDLRFKVVINKRLNIHNTKTKNWPPIPLYTPTGSNLGNVSALCALKNEIINIPDVYHAEGFDFEGMKRFDRANDYHSKSMLVIPMVDHEEELIGVLQLINKTAPDGEIVAFSEQDIQTALAYSAYCAIAITKNRLIEDLEKLLLSFLESIALAMDAKSSVGYGHINRVGKMMEMVAKGINEDRTKYRHIRYTKDQLTQIKLAAWMHDIGKIATPESILNKATKLESTHDRIGQIRERFKRVILSRKALLMEKELAYLKGDRTFDLNKVRQDIEKEIEAL